MNADCLDREFNEIQLLNVEFHLSVFSVTYENSPITEK
ncbi:unnamed protein product [Oikopleura dioica]|uniref:Uncharacterized protein n=1 Tax=Oikopleura dioica TaxID=34765 RepID=E4YW83_OIKDI|nr:unnamed protein product [Oikopleura dioica]